MPLVFELAHFLFYYSHPLARIQEVRGAIGNAKPLTLWGKEALLIAAT